MLDIPYDELMTVCIKPDILSQELLLSLLGLYTQIANSVYRNR
jgi:hypothetical protein